MTYLSISEVADHFVYLPMIGLIGLVVASGEQIGRRFFGGFRVGGIGVAAIAMGLLVCLSRAYAERFVSPTALWTYTLERNSQAWPAHNDLGNILHRSGQIPEAIGQFEQVVQLKPDWAKGHNNLGAALKDSGRTPEAIDQFKQACKYGPIMQKHITISAAHC